jgi:hypothetical protein
MFLPVVATFPKGKRARGPMTLAFSMMEQSIQYPGGEKEKEKREKTKTIYDVITNSNMISLEESAHAPAAVRNKARADRLAGVKWLSP